MDTTKVSGLTGGGGDIYSSFFNFLWSTYFTSYKFWGSIFLVLFLMLLARKFIFDNPKIKWNAESWFYPLVLLISSSFVIWILGEEKFELTKKYFVNWLVNLAGVFVVYSLGGHKFLKWLEKKLNFGNGVNTLNETKTDGSNAQG